MKLKLRFLIFKLAFEHFFKKNLKIFEDKLLKFTTEICDQNVSFIYQQILGQT